MEQIADFYIATVGSDYAQRITDKLLDTLEPLHQFPYMGAQHPDPQLAKQDYRKILCDDYVCVYKVVDHQVYIYRIVNGKTDYPKLLR